MTEIGAQLRAARESQGLSIRDMEQKTRIRAKYLEALEAGEVHRLPGDVYVRLFTRSYATALGLDAVPMLDQMGGKAAPSPIPEPGRSSSLWMEEPLRPNLLPLGSILTPAIVLVVIGVLAWTAWWAYPRRGSLNSLLPLAPTATPNLPGLSSAGSTPIGIAPLATATPTAIFRPTMSPDATATVTPVPTATTPPRVEPSPTPEPDVPTPTATVASTDVLLAIEATEPAWVWIKVDGTQAFMGTLQAGERREWTGAQSVFMRTGNAGGIRLSLNGTPQPPLGAQGQVVNLTWGPNPEGGPPVLLDEAPAAAPTTTG